MKKLLTEGKTKQIYEISANDVLIVGKDRITAMDGGRANEIPDIAALSIQTSANNFTILNAAGMLTDLFCLVLQFFSASEISSNVLLGIYQVLLPHL